MRILLLCHSFNSLTQRLFVELREKGEEVSVEYDISDEILRETLALFRPDLILAPFLKRVIPGDVLRETLCLVVHPGPPGDRGPSALDWAVLEGRGTWGVTLLEAVEELDAGAVWASRDFRHAGGDEIEPIPQRGHARRGRMCLRGAGHDPGRQAARPAAAASTDQAVLCARVTRDRFPARRYGGGPAQNPFGGRRARGDRGNRRTRAFVFRRPRGPRFAARRCGRILARGGKAIAVATRDGAVWIGCLREIPARSLKLPAASCAGDGNRGAAGAAGYSNIALRTGRRGRTISVSTFTTAR